MEMKSVLQYAVLCTIVMIVSSFFSIKRMIRRDLARTLVQLYEPQPKNDARKFIFSLSVHLKRELKSRLLPADGPESDVHIIECRIVRLTYWLFYKGKATARIHYTYGQEVQAMTGAHMRELALAYHFDHDTSHWTITSLDVK